MSVRALFIISLLSLILIIVIISRRYFLIKKLRDFVKEEKVKKERRSLEELEKKSVIKSGPQKPKDWKLIHETRKILSKCDILMSYWDYKEAKKLLIWLLADDEKCLEANLKLGHIYLKEKQYKQAEIFFTKCISIEWKDPAVFTDLWFCFFKMWKYKEAIESYEFAIKLDPGHSWRYTNLGQVYFIINEHEKAEKTFLKALRYKPKNTDIMFMIAENYIEMKNLEKAKDIYEKILIYKPYNQEAIEYIKKLEQRGI